MMNKTCCVTGHRDITEEQISCVKESLYREIMAAVGDGYTNFLHGGAKGVDLIFASIIADLKEQGRPLVLGTVLPHPGWLKRTDPTFQRIVEASDYVNVICEKASPNCFLLRNHYLVDHASRVIAVYDGRERGGTVFTMRLAHVLERDIRLIEIGKD